jgi:hypothetical protein
MEKRKNIDQSNIIIEGTLNKRGTKLLKAFNKRYFVLTKDYVLHYFKQNTPNEPCIGEFYIQKGFEIQYLNQDDNIDKVIFKIK